MKKQFQLCLYYLKRIYHFFKTGLLRGLPGQIAFKFPAKKLKIITITGTDGKTTTSTIAYHLLKELEVKVGLISTVAAYIGDEEIETGLHVTSPDPYQLHQLLRKMVQSDVEYVVLEATSHGAYQFRTWGIKPLIAGLTNIDREHLDYHLDFEHYLSAKALLLNKAKEVVINQNSENLSKIKTALSHKANEIHYFSLEKKLPTKINSALKKRFPEKYNQLNTRLALKILSLLKVRAELSESKLAQKIATAITSIPDIPGRMQLIENRQQLKIVVDFAHTPQALSAVLTTLKKQLSKENKKGKLIAVYGAAGLRDRDKRPPMGEIGAEIADRVIFTAEDPRVENVWAIIRQLKENLSENLDKVMSIPDRGEAIDFAINHLAKKGDTIAILGKGHEKSMCFGKVETPWSDVRAVKNSLKKNKRNSKK